MESSANIGHLRQPVDTTRLDEGEESDGGGEFILWGPSRTAGSAPTGVGMSRYESEKETWRDTWTDRRIDEEGNGGKERAGGVEGIEVYLAFPVPARLLVSYLLFLLLSLSFSPSFRFCRSFFVDGAHRTRERVREIQRGGCQGLRKRARRGS